MRSLRLCLELCVLLAACSTNIDAQVDNMRREETMTITTTSAPAPATVAALALSIRSRAIQDSRCYLMSGGAVESFFISEDTPVGSIIGTLSVNGDPTDASGDISLHVQEKGAAVGIAPGTKNLTLLRALDREERTGPSNVYVNVRCDRRRTTDPSFVIPVSVRVWDVNDNAPAWSGAPYRARVPETAAVGARVLTARATDIDQPGPHATIHYSVLPSENSDYIGFANELDGVLVIKKPLDFETLPNFTLTLRARDAGSPSLHNDTILAITVLDADDQNPKFSSEHYSAVLPDDAEIGTILVTSPGPISAVDQDAGILAPLVYSVSGSQRTLVAVDRDTGRLAATQELLDITQPVTVVIKATQVDNSDRYALATATITRRGRAPLATDGAPPAPLRFRSRSYAASVREDTAPPATLLTLHTDRDQGTTHASPLQFFVSDRSFLEKFAINSAGEVILRKLLDYETQDSYFYQVMVTDGLANDTASINLTVVNVNEWEPRFRYPQYEFHVDVSPPTAPPTEGPGGLQVGAGGHTAGAGGLVPVGKLDVYDGDKADTITVSLRGPDANTLYMSDGGEMFLRLSAVARLNSSVLTVVATAHDSGDPPRQTSVPVVVHVAGLQAAALGGGTKLAAICGAAVLLAALLCLLAVYMRTRRRSKSSPAPVSKPYLAHEKPPSAPLPPASGPPSVGVLPPTGPPAGGSLQSVSAGASTILANSTSSLDLRDTLTHNGGGVGSGGRARAAAGGPLTPVGGPPGGQAALMSDHLARGAGGGRSGVAWPAATIPARVKKLSWDDAQDHSHKESDGPLEASNAAAHEHMNLTVYF